MTWREAFLAQARGDATVRQILNQAKVAYSHQLHYLQMVTEKLAKALMCKQNAPPKASHSAFVNGLRNLKGRPDIRRKLGYDNKESFYAFINSLLPLADKLERLAPTFAGFTQPNPEYPWQSTGSGAVIAPVDFEFEEFDPRLPQMVKMDNLIRQLLDVLN
jgi:hypothetical protein